MADWSILDPAQPTGCPEQPQKWAQHWTGQRSRLSGGRGRLGRNCSSLEGDRAKGGSVGGPFGGLEDSVRTPLLEAGGQHRFRGRYPFFPPHFAAAGDENFSCAIARELQCLPGQVQWNPPLFEGSLPTPPSTPPLNFRN